MQSGGRAFRGSAYRLHCCATAPEVPPLQSLTQKARTETKGDKKKTMKTEWKIQQLSDIVEFNPKETLKKGVIAKKISMDKLQPFCRDICEYELTKFTGGTKFRNGDTIMARITPCLENGKTAKINILDNGEIGFGSTEYIVFRAKEGISDPDFIYYLVTSSLIREPAIKSMVGSSGRQRVQSDVVEKIKINLPPLPVQKKIAGILKSLDDKIELNRQISKNLEEQARCLFEKTFPKNKTFKMLPLSELCTAITKGTTPTTLGKAFAKSGINFIKAESILDNHSVDFDKFSFIDDETNKMLGRSIIYSGDIVFTIAGTLGRFALIDESVIPANTNQAVAIIRSDTKIISPEYLYSFFIGNWHNNYYTKRIQQAVQANLSLGTIKSLPIPILEKNEMKSYLTSLTPIFKIQSEKIKENRKLAQIRDTILPKLMSREIKV